MSTDKKIYDKVPGQVTMWWDQESDCVMMQVADRPPVPLLVGDGKTLKFRDVDETVLGSIHILVHKGNNG